MSHDPLEPREQPTPEPARSASSGPVPWPERLRVLALLLLAVVALHLVTGLVEVLDAGADGPSMGQRFQAATGWVPSSFDATLVIAAVLLLVTGELGGSVAVRDARATSGLRAALALALMSLGVSVLSMILLVTETSTTLRSDLAAFVSNLSEILLCGGALWLAASAAADGRFAPRLGRLAPK